MAPLGESLYRERADLYDLVYADKDYAAEAERLARILAREGVEDGARVLDVACGTGRHLEHLRHRYRVEGLDRSSEMIAIARARLPGVPLAVGDLEALPVAGPVDALLSHNTTIGYVAGEERLRAAARRFAAAVRPGGALAVEPWIAPEDWKDGSVHLHVHDGDEVKLARAAHSRRRGDTAVIDFRWIVARSGRGLESFAERHELWMCPPATLESAFGDAGFDVRLEPDGLTPGRGLLVGTRRSR